MPVICPTCQSVFVGMTFRSSRYCAWGCFRYFCGGVLPARSSRGERCAGLLSRNKYIFRFSEIYARPLASRLIQGGSGSRSSETWSAGCGGRDIIVSAHEIAGRQLVSDRKARDTPPLGSGARHATRRMEVAASTRQPPSLNLAKIVHAAGLARQSVGFDFAMGTVCCPQPKFATASFGFSPQGAERGEARPTSPSDRAHRANRRRPG